MRRIAALCLALAACSSSAPEVVQTLPTPGACKPRALLQVGDPLPACVLRSFDGGVYSLASLTGTPAVINFWASWCTYCIEEMPAFQRVFASLGGRVAFVGADLLGVEGETEGAARTFARRTGVRYRLVFDEGGLLFAHVSSFRGRPVLPATLFVRADGRMAFRQFGPLDDAALRARITEHLGV